MIFVKARDPEAKTTSRQMYWTDADLIALYKERVKRFQKSSGDHFEADRDVLHKMIAFYVLHHPKPPNKIPVSTFPAYEKIIQVSKNPR